MTLEQFATSTGLQFDTPVRYPLARVVPMQDVDRLRSVEKHDMFHLSDYAVTSHTGGAYWLSPRGPRC